MSATERLAAALSSDQNYDPDMADRLLAADPLLVQDIENGAALREQNVRVYVLEMGCYSDRWVKGVFRTLEAAMAAGGGSWKDDEPDANGDRYWHNDKDWDDAASIWSVVLL